MEYWSDGVCPNTPSLQQFLMTCYTDFYPRYCPHCGEPLHLEQELWLAPQQDLLNGLTITCDCGATCRYLPEHRFPYQPEAEAVAVA